MSDLDEKKLDLLEKKIGQLELKVKSSLEEKLKEVADDCDDLYKQITEIRNTIQEMYGEILESGRFQANQLLRMSERLESMAKDIYKNSGQGNGPSIEVHVNPEINPVIDNSNRVSSEGDNNSVSEKPKTEKKKKFFDIKKMSMKEMIFYISSVILGIAVVIGGVGFSFYKLFDLVSKFMGW